MYELPDTKGFEKAHVQYYSHGAATILRETAHPYSLFLLEDECIDIDLSAIYQKVNVRVLQPGEDEPLITKEDNVYFTRFSFFLSCSPTLFDIS
jgi:DNA (cytosine-5)-methyltransferase 1